MPGMRSCKHLLNCAQNWVLPGFRIVWPSEPFAGCARGVPQGPWYSWASWAGLLRCTPKYKRLMEVQPQARNW